jgi:hypothetical protein
VYSWFLGFLGRGRKWGAFNGAVVFGFGNTDVSRDSEILEIMLSKVNHREDHGSRSKSGNSGQLKRERS